MSSLSKYELLIYKHLLGKNSIQEDEDLSQWIQKDVNNKSFYDSILKEWAMIHLSGIHSDKNQLWIEISSKAQKRRVRFLRRRLYWSVACVAVFVLGFAVWFLYPSLYNRRSSEEKEIISSLYFPQLILSDGETCLLNKMQDTIIEKDGATILLSTKGELEYQRIDTTNGTLLFNTLKVPRRCDYSLILEDGTRVWLNAESELKYPVHFANDKRVIYAKGEVFCDVAKDAQRPFYVVSSDIEVRVLGTVFNINSYPENPNAYVTLLKGEVVGYSNGKTYALNPNEQLCLNRNNHEVTLYQVDAERFGAWRYGYYFFNKESLSEIAKTLERWYDVQIILKSKRSAQFTFTGIVNKEEDIQRFIERLSLSSNLHCTLENNRLYIE